ncbi:hypothetical protein BD769DRAFT_1421698 [Suillus cothurnatus]|nr:hypothetical protein BD769DRAFT_1421698 [Suillus cothurnatus]
MSSSTAHPSAVGTNTQPRTSTLSSTEAPTQTPSEVTDNNELPPQRHAGATGLGPLYGQGAEIKGKITKNPELVQHGRERRTGDFEGERARTGTESSDDEDPFKKPEEHSQT